MRGIVLFAHGARDREWSRPFEAIRERVRAKRPEYRIELAYLEFMSPALDVAIESVIAEGAMCVTVFPLFMAEGGHVRRDIPRILDDLRARHPRIPIVLESAIGEVPEILEAIAGWILSRAE
ncbi:MAG TPA: CbiX/SirB N-terminal domain-containing protein [Usitatibacter sp.]|nr:CbiX/SirB N-terminal domain-containing protein [Usitatibacter sp.]